MATALQRPLEIEARLLEDREVSLQRERIIETLKLEAGYAVRTEPHRHDPDQVEARLAILLAVDEPRLDRLMDRDEGIRDLDRVPRLVLHGVAIETESPPPDALADIGCQQHIAAVLDA